MRFALYAMRELSPPQATFRVRNETFANYLDNNRGDEGIVGLACEAPLGAQLTSS